MKNHRLAFIPGLFLVGMACAPSLSQAQADPTWLKSWNEAQSTRPQTLSWQGRIAAEGEPGEPMIIHGEVFDPLGGPAAGVLVHAYHRDQEGLDFGPRDDELTTWRLQGWALTDAEGRFEFRTIRPAADHLGREGPHIHITLQSEAFGRQWAPKVFLGDDPLVTPEQRQRSLQAGEFGAVREVETLDGVQHVRVKIQLRDVADF